MLTEVQGKMSGYAALLYYRYCCLCVKADPISLLAVEVQVDGTAQNIEDVANVSSPRADQLAIYPNDQRQLFNISKAVKQVHPEFKIEEEDTPEEDGGGTNDEGVADKHLLCTMPEMNDDRRKVLKDAVKALYDEAIGKIDVNNTLFSERIALKLAGAEGKEIDEAKDALKELNDKHKEMCDNYKKAKEEEIEEAYKAYEEDKKNKEKQKKEEEAASNIKAATGMKMPGQ